MKEYPLAPVHLTIISSTARITLIVRLPEPQILVKAMQVFPNSISNPAKFIVFVLSTLVPRQCNTSVLMAIQWTSLLQISFPWSKVRTELFHSVLDNVMTSSFTAPENQEKVIG